jgi:hypothetical protein
MVFTRVIVIIPDKNPFESVPMGDVNLGTALVKIGICQAFEELLANLVVHLNPLAEHEAIQFLLN